MGFCLFNNVAIAAQALRRDGVERILILDWDVHHGNGTQHLFEEDRDVLYFSTHQFPFYPGTGDFVEAGHGRGAGATVNVPLPPGCGDAEYVGVLRRILVPVALALPPATHPGVMRVRRASRRSAGVDAGEPRGLRGDDAHAARRRRRRSAAVASRSSSKAATQQSGLYEGTAAVLDASLDAASPALARRPRRRPAARSRT